MPGKSSSDDHDQLPEDWNRALLSIYYHGRRREPPFAGLPPLPMMWSMARAVSVLSAQPPITSRLYDPESATVIHARRIALAELCRTRAKRTTPAVLRWWNAMVTSYSTTLTSPPRPATEFAQDLDKVFAGLTPSPPDPDAVYVECLNIMHRFELGHDAAGDVLISYEVVRQ